MSAYRDADDDDHQATQWQVSEECDNFDRPIADIWAQKQNWFDGRDLQPRARPRPRRIAGLANRQTYCWRSRVRDSGSMEPLE